MSFLTYHELVQEQKVAILTRALLERGGNRTRTARDLGLQRTYLIRLIRELGVAVSAPVRRRVS